MGDILDKIGEYMNKKVKYGIAGACLMLIIFIVYMICTYNPDRYYKSYEEENFSNCIRINIVFWNDGMPVCYKRFWWVKKKTMLSQWK